MKKFDDNVLAFIKSLFDLDETDIYNLSREEWGKIRDRCFMKEANYENETEECLKCVEAILHTSYKELHE